MCSCLQQAFVTIPEDPVSAQDTTGTQLTLDPEDSAEFSLSEGASGLCSPGPFSPPLTPAPFSPPLQPGPSSRPQSAPPLPSPSSSSGVASQKTDYDLYKKRGKKNTAVDEAVELMRKIASEPSNQPDEDSAYIFGCLVAQRLREIEKNSTQGIAARRQCEVDIMTVLTKY